MNRWLTICIALALLAAAWLSGCAGLPAGTTPAHEATTGPAMGETEEAMERRREQTGSPTGEKATIIPTRAPLTEEGTVTSEPADGTPDTIPPSDARQVVQLAKEDLARKVSVAPEPITVVSIDAVNWPDTSLGCPEPGMMYAQVITPGFRVTLEAAAKTYEYHTDRSSVVVLCEVGGGSASKGTDATVDDGWPSQPRDEGEVDTSRITPIPPPR